MRYREPAICLRTVDYSETSQVVHFLTRDEGIVHLMAKGTKRPKSKAGGAIDLTSEGELVFISKAIGAMGTLVEFTESVSHLGLRKDRAKLFGAMFMLELVSATVLEGDPHPDLFALIHNGLARLDEEDSNAMAVTAYFQWRLLRHVGLSIRIDQCVSCDGDLGAGQSARAGEAYFNSSLGGLICRDCEASVADKKRISPETLAGLDALLAAESGRPANLTETQARGVNRLLSYHIQQHIGKPLHMPRHITGPPGK